MYLGCDRSIHLTKLVAKNVSLMTNSFLRVGVSKVCAVLIITLTVCLSHSIINLRWSSFSSLRSSRME